jgi:hypothetical protein
MNKEIAELLKSNRKIINITPEDVIDVENINESQESLKLPETHKSKDGPDSTS